MIQPCDKDWMMMIDPTGSINPPAHHFLTHTWTAFAWHLPATAQPPVGHRWITWATYFSLIRKKEHKVGTHTHTHVICLFLSFVSRFACVAIIHPSNPEMSLIIYQGHTILSFSLCTQQPSLSSSRPHVFVTVFKCLAGCFSLLAASC